MVVPVTLVFVPKWFTPVTLPVTEVLVPVITPPTVLAAVTVPTALIPPLDVQTFDVLLYRKVRYGDPIGPASIPAPLAAELLIALLAKLIVRSFVLTTLELIVVVLPLTCKLPAMTTRPSTPPDAFGSMVRVGPLETIVLPLIVRPPIVAVPAVVKLAPVTLPVTLTLVPVITPPTTLALVIDPVELINPPVSMLPLVMLPAK